MKFKLNMGHTVWFPTLFYCTRGVARQPKNAIVPTLATVKNPVAMVIPYLKISQK